ncbi:hypothetical protein ACFQPF_15715 [Fictibacillus iocasae]|uniref:Uncharacterized protein n=1 Tax=Fictibacillus iocasae TaxID=2715437 RepID=A0ABW2NUR5_9BACL
MAVSSSFFEDTNQHETNKINELLLRIKKYDKKESIAGLVANAMKECGYNNENIYQVIKKLHEEIDNSPIEETNNWRKLLP